MWISKFGNGPKGTLANSAHRLAEDTPIGMAMGMVEREQGREACAAGREREKALAFGG